MLDIRGYSIEKCVAIGSLNNVSGTRDRTECDRIRDKFSNLLHMKQATNNSGT